MVDSPTEQNRLDQVEGGEFVGMECIDRGAARRAHSPETVSSAAGDEIRGVILQTARDRRCIDLARAALADHSIGCRHLASVRSGS